MKIAKIAGLLLMTAALAACAAVTKTDTVSKPSEVKSGFMGLSSADDVVIDNAKAFAGVNKVIIGNFTVAFLEEKRGSNKAGGGYGGKASATMTLKGLTPELMQQITDAAYADFVSKLQAKGYTVADRGQLLNYPDFAKTESQPSPLKEESSFFGASTDTTFVTPSGFGPIRFFMGEFGKGLGLSAMGNNPFTAANKFAGETKIPVISATYTIDFANTGGHGGRFSMSASLQVGQGISVAPGSGVSLVGGWQGGTFSANPNGSAKLGQAVGSDAEFGTVTNTTSGAAVGAEVALNVVTALMGAGTNQNRSFEITADPAKYASGAKAVLSETNSALIGQMAASR